MPHISLTQLGAERIRPANADVIYWDNNLPGFGLRVSSKGRKSFLVQYRVRAKGKGKSLERQEVLGTLAFLTVAQARDRARQAKAKASEGVDPVAERKATAAQIEAMRQADAFTLNVLVERYMAEYVARNNRGTGAQTKDWLLRRWVAALGDQPAEAITEADVLGFKDRLLKGRNDGYAQVDHLIGVMKHMYAWAQTKKLVTHNPADHIAKEWKYKARERYLSQDEIKRFWTACDAIGWPAGPIFKLLLLTGQREAEIGSMRWAELNLDERTLNLPSGRTKNGKAHTVHLSDLALEIIAALPRFPNDGSPYVFTYDGKKAFRSFTRNRQRVQKLMGDDVPDFTVHDLRRTAVTLMVQIGVAHHVADKILNHTGGKISGVAAVYNRFEYLDERRDAFEALARKVAAIISDNVVQLRAAGE
jgi:integrase